MVGGPNVVIIAEHKVADPGVKESGVRLFTSTVRRPPPDTLDQRLNCHSKLHEVIALVQATQVYLHGQGGAGFWLQLLAAYDAIFTALGVLLADVVLEVE